MSSRGFAPLDFALFPKPSSLSRGASSARLSFSASCLRRSNRVGGAAAASRPILFPGRRGGFGRGIRSASNAGSGPESVATSAGSVEEDPEAAQLFEKLKDAERQRISKLEELERKANVQLERQLVMASSWSRALLTMRGKLKGTEWDPENSHRIDYSDFLGLLNTNNVQFVGYSNYGQTMSVLCSDLTLL